MYALFRHVCEIRVASTRRVVPWQMRWRIFSSGLKLHSLTTSNTNISLKANHNCGKTRYLHHLTYQLISTQIFIEHSDIDNHVRPQIPLPMGPHWLTTPLHRHLHPPRPPSRRRKGKSQRPRPIRNLRLPSRLGHSRLQPAPHRRARRQQGPLDMRLVSASRHIIPVTR